MLCSLNKLSTWVFAYQQVAAKPTGFKKEEPPSGVRAFKGLIGSLSSIISVAYQAHVWRMDFISFRDKKTHTISECNTLRPSLLLAYHHTVCSLNFISCG